MIGERLDAIYAIAQHRAAYSPEEDAAHELAAGWMREAGLEVGRDEAGNLFGRRGDARIWVGSHLDSVPTAGRFDGALGVVAGDRGGAAAARRSPRGRRVPRRGDRADGLAGGSTEQPDAYLEVHIEQGPVLERLGEPLGVVTAIAGQARGQRVFEGRADHAGTTPMDARADALVEAAGSSSTSATARARGPWRPSARSRSSRTRPTSCRRASPSSVDARSADAALLDALIADDRLRRRLALRPGADGRRVRRRPARRAAPRLRAPGTTRCVVANPSMLFVRSLNGGISHHPDELSSEEDMALAVDALTAALVRLAA